MGRYRVASGLMMGAVLAALPCLAAAEVLVYKNDNKWVAAEDNKPLQALLKAARGGKTRYAVRLPVEKRELGITRLEVVRDLLAREAKAAVVMEEANGNAKPNTVVIE